MPTPKKKPTPKKVAPKKATKQVELTALDYHAIQLHEFYTSLRNAGFDSGTAITLICDKDAHPHWFTTASLHDFEEWEQLRDERDDD